MALRQWALSVSLCSSLAPHPVPHSTKRRMESDQFVLMCKSMISACKSVEGLGVPAAVVLVRGDRFLFANECFLQIVGLTSAELTTTSLLKIVTFPLNCRLDAEPVPATIRTPDQNLTIRGHIGSARKGLAYVVIPPKPHRTTVLHRKHDRQRPGTYLSGQLSSERLVGDFSIEYIRSRSPIGDHSAELGEQEIGGNI
jgi:hypothetical protein